MALLRVTESHVRFDRKGIPTVLTAGQIVPSDSPFVKGHEHQFEPIEDAVRTEAQPVRATPAVTETADASPGHARVRTAPKSSPKAKADDKPAEGTDGA